MLVSLGDIDAALTILREVTSDKPHFVRARMTMARVLLQHKNDKRGYAQVFAELVRSHPSPHTYLLLGEALMRIMEPERAIAAYEVRPRCSRSSAIAHVCLSCV